MKFTGIKKIFSTHNSEQFKTIGRFWDDMSEKYGRDNLRGLGYNWNESSLEYAIGLKEGNIEDANMEVLLPEDGWKQVSGKTDNLAEIYDRIYMDGVLRYEIEMFDETGNCCIMYHR